MPTTPRMDPRTKAIATAIEDATGYRCLWRYDEMGANGKVSRFSIRPDRWTRVEITINEHGEIGFGSGLLAGTMDKIEAAVARFWGPTSRGEN